MNMKSMQTIFLSTVVGLLVTLASGVTAQTMKIAVPATGSEKNSLILPQKRYFERIWNKGFQFVIYHHISFDPKKNRRNITPGGFSAIYSDKIIIANKKIINVKSKRLFLKLFGSNKKKILEYMKSNNMRYRKANNSQLKQLMQYCYENASIN